MKNEITTHDDGKRADVTSTQPGQSVRIMGFVDGDVIPPACYDKPYCLTPGKDDDKAYEVLREVMHRTRKVGLASVVIEKKQTLAAVIPIGRTLVLNVLRFATGLIPRNQRVPAARAQGTKSTGTASAGSAPRKRLVAVPDAPKPAARIAPVRKRGEVIDLAVRRSSKRAAQPRSGKAPRARGTGVATLHELRRKSPGRQVERQLA